MGIKFIQIQYKKYMIRFLKVNYHWYKYAKVQYKFV